MLWFNFIIGLNFISLCFKLIVIYYHTPKQREIKFKPRIKLNHNMYFPVVTQIPRLFQFSKWSYVAEILIPCGLSTTCFPHEVIFE